MLSGALRARLGWPLVRSPAPPERVEFEELCATWAKHRSYPADIPENIHEQTRPSLPESRTSSLTVPSEMSSRATSLQASMLASHHQEETTTLVSHEPFERVGRTFRCFVSWKADA